MACQGCGNMSSENKLCCPTCIELNRTSFFCGQECFTKNWKAHNQLHDLLRRQKKLEESVKDQETGQAIDKVLNACNLNSDPSEKKSECVAENGVTASNGVSPNSSSAMTRTRPAQRLLTEESNSYVAPLPGGSSLLSSIGARPRAASRDRRPGKNGTPLPGARAVGASAGAAAGANTPGGAGMLDALGGAVGSVWSMVSGAQGPSTSGAAASTSSGAAVSQTAATKRAATAQSPKSGPIDSNGKPVPSMLGGHLFRWRNLLLGLVVITIVAGFALYRMATLRYDADMAAMEMPPEPVEPAPLLGSEVGLNAVAALGGSAAIAQSSAGAAAALAESQNAVTSLRGEVVALRGLVDRHEKMLRYVMDRYVEKDSGVAVAAGATVAPEQQQPAASAEAVTPATASSLGATGAASPLGVGGKFVPGREALPEATIDDAGASSDVAGKPGAATIGSVVPESQAGSAVISASSAHEADDSSASAGVVSAEGISANDSRDSADDLPVVASPRKPKRKGGRDTSMDDSVALDESAGGSSGLASSDGAIADEANNVIVPP